MVKDKFKDIPMELYKILNTEKDEFWTTYNNKCVWAKAAYAKAAWTNTMWRERVKFNDQDKYVIIVFSTEGWDIERL